MEFSEALFLLIDGKAKAMTRPALGGKWLSFRLRDEPKFGKSMVLTIGNKPYYMPTDSDEKATDWTVK